MNASPASLIGPKPALPAAALPPGLASKLSPAAVAKARATGQDFEAVFLNSMFSQMFTGIGTEGPFGGGPATGVWRSFLTDEYAKSFAKSGGIGLAPHVFSSLIAQQSAK